jgi:nuclear transport factor 2 (NTF2) superfamily protein
LPERICAVLVAAFEAHPETRHADRCAISLDNQRGVVVDDYDDPGELWTAGRVAAHYAVGVRFIYAHADDLGALRLGAGPRPRLRFDPAMVRERWASVNALPSKARTRQHRRPTTKLHAVPSVELLDYECDD